ncbi:MAG: hypothetical protein ACE5K0_12685, partial [Candidatus Methanofastidiosia archaeon]
MKKPSIYDLFALSLIVLLTLLTLWRFQIFPIFIDIYYHTSVMIGFDMAGGITTWDFWEYAPEGRVHLYAPLLHVLMLMMLKSGLSVEFIAKFTSFVMFPLSQMTLWFFMREIYSRRSGFYSVLLLSVSQKYFFSQAVTSAASLTLIFTPFIFWALEKNRIKTAIVLLTATLYSHIGIGPLSSLALLIYGLVYRRRTKATLKILITSYLLYLPWLFRILMNLDVIRAGSPRMTFALEEHILLVLFAILGIGVGFLKRGKYWIPTIYLVSLVPILFSYSMRFSHHSTLPLAMLGGLSLSFIDVEICKKVNTKILGVGLALSLLLILNFFNPVSMIGERGFILRLDPTLIQKLIIFEPSSRFSSNNMSEENLALCDFIEKNTNPYDIIDIRNGPMGVFITTFTGRATTSGMWHEVQPEGGNPHGSKLVIIEEGPQREAIPFEKLPFLKEIGRVGRYTIYENTSAQEDGMRISEAIVPWWLAFAFVFAGFFVIGYDVLRGRKMRSDLPRRRYEGLPYPVHSNDRREKNLKNEKFTYFLVILIFFAFLLGGMYFYSKTLSRRDLRERPPLNPGFNNLPQKPPQFRDSLDSHFEKASEFLRQALERDREAISKAAFEFRAIALEIDNPKISEEANFIAFWLETHPSIEERILIEIIRFCEVKDLKGLKRYL